MATITRENLPKHSVKLTITVSADELQPYLQHAAAHVSEHAQIPGFRPGHATYEAAKSHVGEMKILEEALEEIVRKSLAEAVQNEQLQTVGSPAINVEKMAPGNDLVYTAELALMPEVEKLADFTKLTIKRQQTTVTEDDVAKALRELQKMQRKEVRAGGETTATGEDKAVIDLVMKKDGVVVEGGAAKNYQVYLNEPHYIAGFADALVGMKEKEIKTFALAFPKEHYQKHLAGEEITFEVTLHELYHLDTPAVDDAFAASLGQKDLPGLQTLLRANMEEEKKQEEALQQEREMLSLIAKESRFSEMPDLLVNQEVSRMVQELQTRVEEQGGKFEEYLQSIKKTLAQLKLDLTAPAIERIKVTLVLRALARELEIVVNADEIDAALDELAKQYETKESRERIYSVEHRDYMGVALKNKKTIERLREAMVK